MMRLAALAQVSAELAATRSRVAKTNRLADFLRTCSPDGVGIAALWLTGETGKDKLGVGPALVRTASTTPPRSTPSLTLPEACQRLADIGAITGDGSKARRARVLAALFAAATKHEQGFLARLLLGELRQGALASLVVDAIAEAFDIETATVRRAWMLCADVAEVAAVARRDGQAGLAQVGLILFRPIQPMLAQPADDIADALARIRQPILEYKLDGARVQIHKRGAEVRVFSRQGNDVTTALPEIVAAISALSEAELVIDGETLALASDGSPLPFQTTMRRFGRHGDDPQLRSQLPLTLFCFDCLACGGETLIDSATGVRHSALADSVPSSFIIPRQTDRTPDQAAAFLTAALAAGHEGLMAKDRDAPYAAGGRGSHWLKIKQVHTLDLVVLAAEWGSGRRAGRLSNLHLGVRDQDGGYLMLGKTFKGLTDYLLDWQTEQLLAREIGRNGHVVHVRPELVVEIAFNELQQSRQYPAGLALRFARVKRYRPDKTCPEADHINAVRALFARQVAYRPRDERAAVNV
ncbi:MAG: ATP-dependent DNA ligase [Thiohalocapsa sp.]